MDKNSFIPHSATYGHSNISELKKGSVANFFIVTVRL